MNAITLIASRASSTATSSPGRPRARGRAYVLPLVSAVLIAAVIGLLFLTTPRGEDFWWTDAATFALNGELIRDYVTSGLGQDPMAFAMAWYLRYPALTISLYPPIFPMAEAVVFALFGFSHTAAQATVSLFAVLAAYGMYRTARTVTGVLPATAAVILLFAAPEVLRWSRQVVLEIPALAFLLLAAAALPRYQNGGGTRWLFAAVLLVLAAVHTKQPALFVAPAFAAALLAEDGRALVRRKSTWIALAAGVAGLVPLAVFTVLYAPVNIDIAFGAGTASASGDQEVSRLSVQAFTIYARALPDIVGIVPLAASAAYLLLVAWRGWRGPAERRLAVLMLAWFVSDYVLISGTGHFEARYGVFLTVPPVVLTVLLAHRLLMGRQSGAVMVAASMALFLTTVALNPVPRISGYDAIAEYVLSHASADDTVLFHGKESKNFTFSMRARSPAPKVFVLRAEKLLVKYSIVREWGITDRNLSADEVEAMIDRLGVTWVVLQPDFWTDQPSIEKLQRLTYSGRFTEVAAFPITSDDPGQRATLRVYRNNRPVAPASRRPTFLELSPLGGTVPGNFQGGGMFGRHPPVS